MPHRVILIGAGHISTRYFNAIERMEEMTVAAIAGRSPAKNERICARHGIDVHGTDIAETARRAHADIALVCTPNAVHAQNVIESARSGLHVLCEKPLHNDPQVQRDMIAACRDAKRLLGVCYARRLYPHMQHLKHLIDTGGLGRVRSMDVTVRLYRPPSYYDHPWHGSIELDGGGPFMQQAPHYIDLAQWLAGGWQHVYHAACFRLCHDIPVEDHGYAVLRYNRDIIGSITASTACPGARDELLTVCGDKGSVTVDSTGYTRWEVENTEPPGDLSHGHDITVSLLRDFADAVDTGRPPAISGESAARTTELVHAVYKKAGTIHTV